MPALHFGRGTDRARAGSLADRLVNRVLQLGLCLGHRGGLRLGVSEVIPFSNRLAFGN